jgi:hypothetical protein
MGHWCNSTKGKTKVLRRRAGAMLPCPPQLANEMDQYQCCAFAVRGRWVTALGMVRPFKDHNQCELYLTFWSLAVSLCTTRFNIKKFHVVPTLRLCVLYGSQNKRRLFRYTALTDSFLQPRRRVFTARYVLGPYIKQITFRLQRVKEAVYSSQGRELCHMEPNPLMFSREMTVVYCENYLKGKYTRFLKIRNFLCQICYYT